MKLISLNIWEGKLYQPLVCFLEQYSESADIFCFQEVFKDADAGRKKNLVFTEVKKILPDFEGYFEDYIAPGNYGKEGLAIFIKKYIKVEDRGEIFVYNPETISLGNDDPKSLWRNLQFVKFVNNGKNYTIANFHGLFDGPDKRDNLNRMEQSRRVKEFLDKTKGRKIICGDFNLLPNSESLRILETGMLNLIRKYGILSTRSSYFDYPNKFADYVLVSPDLSINRFEVMDYAVSDHLPIFLDFE